ncbi:hypothetical protein, partial [Hymenobacter agri]
MKAFFRVYVLGGALTSLLLLSSTSSFGQRAESGPPASDPFGRRVVPARAVPGGRYVGHQVVRVKDASREYVGSFLEVKATDGSLRRIQSWAPGVVKISYFPTGSAFTADSSLSVVQPPQPVRYETGCNHGCDGPPPAELVRKYGADVCSGVFVYPNKLVFNVNCQTLVIDKQTLAVSVTETGSSTTSRATEANAPFRRVTAPATAATLPEPGGVGVRFRLA